MTRCGIAEAPGAITLRFVVAVPKALAEILVCPRCKGALEHRLDPECFDCPGCRLRYRVDDGIPVMLVAEAVPLPASAP